MRTVVPERATSPAAAASPSDTAPPVGPAGSVAHAATHPAAASAWPTAGLAVLVAAFLLRLHGLTDQSLWYDEGLTVWYARQPLPEMVARLANDEHPPLYFALLGGWTALAGADDFALRFLSVAWGVLGVAATWALVARLAGRPAGLAAALLLALSPFHVWYSQEVRSYTALLALGALALYCLLRVLAPVPARPRWLVALALFNAAGLWMHLQFGLIGAVEAAWLLLYVAWPDPAPGPPAGIRARLRRAALAGLAPAAGALLFLPWLPNLAGVLGASDTYWPGTLEPADMLRVTALAWVVGDRLATLGPDLGYAIAPEVIAVALGAAALGALWLIVRGRTFGALALAVALALPCALLALLVMDRPKFVPRYLLLVLPVLLGLVGAAIAGLAGGAVDARRFPAPVRALALLPGLGVAVLWLALALPALLAQAGDTRLWREDYRGAAEYLGRVAAPNDAIVLVSGYSQVAFNHYYHGPAPVFALPDETVPHLRRALRWEWLDRLNAVVEGRRRVWVVEWQANVLDPSGLVHQQLALATRAAREGAVGLASGGFGPTGHASDPGAAFHGLHLARYDLDPAIAARPDFPIRFEPAEPLDLRFDGGRLELTGFDLAPGHWAFRVMLYWRVLAPVGRDLTGFVHLLSPREHLYGGLDRPPINPVYSSSRWRAGDLLRDEYELPVARNAPPGVYRIEVGLYDAATGERVPIQGADGVPVGDRVVIGEVAIGPEHAQRPPEPPLEFDPPLPVRPGLALIGWERPGDEPGTGGALTAALYWTCTAPQPPDLRFGLALRAADGRLLADVLEPPADGLYPSERWRPGDTVRDVHTLNLSGVPPGDYTLLALAAGPDGARQTFELGPVTLR